MADFNAFNVSFASFIAGGTIVANRAVVLDSTAGQVVAASAIAGLTIGIATTGASSGEVVTVQLFGKAKVAASAAISLGAEVMTTASGAGKVSTAAGPTAMSIGLALQAAGADGDIIEVLLATPNLKGSANS